MVYIVIEYYYMYIFIQWGISYDIKVLKNKIEMRYDES